MGSEHGCAIKVCGVTNVKDAELCVTLGVESVGINFYEKSPRFCSPMLAKKIIEALGDNVYVVGVFVDATLEHMRAMRDALKLDCLQLHGNEAPETLKALLPHAYKCIRTASAQDLKHADEFDGDYLLLDAYDPERYGGTGKTFDWTIAQPLAQKRHLILAGGLNPANVQQAILQAQPFAVDVASGVETSPGVKDPDRLRDFVSAVRHLPQI